MYYMLLDIDWSFFNKVYYRQTVAEYVMFVAIILATQLLKKPIAFSLTRISSSIAMRYSYMRHKDTLRDLLFKPIERLLQTILYFIATEQLANLSDGVIFQRIITKKNIHISLGDITDHVFLLLFILFLTQFVTHFIDFMYYVRIGKAEEEKNVTNEQMLPLIKEISKLLAWVMSIFWILGGVFHVNIPALVTGLGIGGVAIALAGKETVENFFASFTILSDKPFQAGDIIKLGEIEGTVERIGFRSTRIRNVDGAAYIVPNQNLVAQSLINLSSRNTRGMKLVANIRYGVTHQTLTQLTIDLREMLVNTPPVQEPVTAILENFDKETFQLVVSYHLPHPLPDVMTLPTLKHEINLKIFELISGVATLGAPTVIS